VKVCDKTCIFCFFPIINKYLCMAKRSLLSERPSYIPKDDTPETLHDTFNPLNAELNPICHLLALLGAHPILHVSRIRVNWAIILQYFSILNYELFCKRNGISLSAHFTYLNSGSLLGLKMAKK